MLAGQLWLCPWFLCAPCLLDLRCVKRALQRSSPALKVGILSFPLSSYVNVCLARFTMSGCISQIVKLQRSSEHWFCRAAGPLLLAFLQYLCTPEIQADFLVDGFHPLPQDILAFSVNKALTHIITDPSYPSVGAHASPMLTNCCLTVKLAGTATRKQLP